MEKSKASKKWGGAKYWEYVTVEGFCGIYYALMRDKYVRSVEVPKGLDGKLDFYVEPKKFETHRNKCYIRKKIPKYCRKKVGAECLRNDKGRCPFFLFGEIYEKDFKEIMLRKWHIKKAKKI